jgi:hypothetical protein
VPLGQPLTPIGDRLDGVDQGPLRGGQFAFQLLSTVHRLVEPLFVGCQGGA